MQVNKVGEQNLFRLLGHFSLLVLLSGASLHSSSFEDFKKAQNTSFSIYTDERDHAFKNHLEAQWKEFKAQKSIPLYEKPKPQNIISTVAKPIKSVGPKISVFIAKKQKNETVKKKKIMKKEVIKIDIKPKITIEEVIAIKKDVNFDFYGTQIGLNIDPNIKNALYYPQNQKGISNFFDTLASSEYEYLVTKIEEISTDLELNDWGKYLLVTMLSRELFDSKDNVNLFNWFIFNKLGYRVKVGVLNRHIVVMYHSKKIIYATPSYKFSGEKYYVLTNYIEERLGSLYSYEHNYPDADKSLDLSLNQLPNFSKDMKNKKLLFKQFGKEYSVKYRYNQNLINFMSTYPQADYETFFNTPLDEQTYDDIAKDLKKHIDGLQASSAINFVLNFVQNAFKYETDNKQFGREKVMFAQETLYFDNSDCEDRAILFSSLVKRIFKIGVIGVKYSDHMATALYIPITGDSIKTNGRKFVIADPTYVNANIGQSMPKYRSIQPESFIIVKN